MKKSNFSNISRRLFIGSLLPIIGFASCSKNNDSETKTGTPDGGKNIPDKDGMTVKGVVLSNNTGVANVVVSDGIVVTKTDVNGIYYLPSTKLNPYVFISIPGNYEAAPERGIPKFFQSLNLAANVVETKNFELIAVDNTNHVVLAMADLHLANRNNDISQFESGFINDVNEVIKTYKDSGTKIYGLTLGDLTWDSYWYANNYFLDDYRAAMIKINTSIFNIMGNHDNDPYYTDDHKAAHAFRTSIGPSYYSFNLGKVHYVVLDNVEYVNTGGTIGTIGDRSYNAKIVSTQMDWLKKDLSMIDKSTPIVVAMHIQLNNRPVLNSSGKLSSTVRLSNGDELLAILNDFNKVHILTGHTHINYVWENSASVTEHNTAAVCATWWWTGRDGYAGNHICKDGSPGGYSIWEVNGKDLKWQYKGIGQPKDYQFRAYDLNKCHITAAKFAPKTTDQLLKSYAGEYANPNLKNEVLINVWGFDEKWKIEVTENGNLLPVTRVEVKDPLHIISYEAFRLNENATPTSDFTSSNANHMFKVTASNATNTLIIKVTDRFNRQYTETMIRPKELTYSMK
ncbi:calcineurin-like phosphoesterase C-terminal domain-containing protein [Sphingobacterium faecale]|uniref:Calcineurin-like phosphoesterase C-terminal domain-containing protein n=1 Tax=Sphingobacterium faecale TaxID=2803775 RepID=A0ABS1R4B8_9SPHI|nr:calcineurin-like phosphoesterase family protein [Sphingobacterium faecale]MBL1409335.1 calcineurin-like phosphoesterase C-terminal domain-containing protein [Sphingobacterium faecale]